MTEKDLTPLLGDAKRAGVFRVTADQRPAIGSAARGLGFALRTVDLASAGGKPDLMGAVSRALAFPEWFGANWDALEDCLTDMSWLPAPGYAVLMSGCERYRASDPEGFQTALDIFADASQFWRAEGVAFWTLVDLPQAGAPRLKLLPDE